MWNPEHDEARPPLFEVWHEYDDCYFCRLGWTGTPNGEDGELGTLSNFVEADELPSNYEGYGPPDDS
jgi:hypothetical protein